MPTNLATGTSIVVHCVALLVVQVPWDWLWSGASVPGILDSWLSLVISAPGALISLMPWSGAYFMLGTGWAGGLSCLLSSVLSGAGASPVLGVAGLLVWSGWDGLSSASVWPGWDVPLSVRMGWGGLMPGLAGVVSAPMGD